MRHSREVEIEEESIEKPVPGVNTSIVAGAMKVEPDEGQEEEGGSRTTVQKVQGALTLLGDNTRMIPNILH